VGVRPGKGEVAGQGFLDRVRKDGQDLFLQAVAREAPEVLLSLETSVLPLFRSLDYAWMQILDGFRLNRRTQMLSRQWQYDRSEDEFEILVRDAENTVPTSHIYSVLLHGPPGPPFRDGWLQAEPLRSALRSWAKSFHLTDTWVLDAALHTLGFWYWVAVPDQPFWYNIHFNKASIPAEWRRLTFRRDGWSTPFVHSGWRAFDETWAKFEADVHSEFLGHLEAVAARGERVRGAKSEFAEALRTYRLDVLQRWTDWGYDVTRSKKEPKLDWDDPDDLLGPQRHYSWLALYQCKEWRPKK
jgi:hypothetical protein